MTYNELISYLDKNNVEYRKNDDQTITFVDFMNLPQPMRHQIYSDMGINLQLVEGQNGKEKS